MRKYSNRIIASFLAIFFIFSSINANIIHVHGEEENVNSNWQTCIVYEGSNVNSQDYDRYSSTIKSYLTVTNDGNLMKLQALSDGRIIIEYYTPSYKLLPGETVELHDGLLPIFGGFYETDDFYFIVSGQKNESEKNDVEVFRITKYDKNWELIDSTGLYGSNTTIPFDAGTVRMDNYGDYLLIRTCHEMYTSSDGLNHQSNVTIQVRISDMSITDSYTGVMNSDWGYISHSFNQFIKIDANGHIIAVDHGDAASINHNTRGVVLTKYPTNVSNGSFSSGQCDVTIAHQFAGASGENYTGASIGGLEISDSNYLIAGNSVIQDESYKTRTTRNIYVWAVDKITESVSAKQITNYQEGEGTTSTPHLVKINNNEFVLLWTRDNTVFYVQIDGSGNIVGDKHSMSGSLSDCMPVVKDNKLVWYTWDDENINFYEISLNNLDETNIKEIKNGHDFQSTGLVNLEGTIEVKCSHCDLVKDLAHFININVWWNKTGSGNYWSTAIDNLDVNERSYYYITAMPSPCDDEFEIIVENPDIVSWTPTNDNYSMGYFTGENTGTTKVIIRSKVYSLLDEDKMAPELKEKLIHTFTFTVNGPLSISSFVVDKDSQSVNSDITLTAEAIGGTWDYTYKFYQKDADGNESIIYEGKNLSCAWTPTSAGKTTLFVDVNDGNTTVTESLEYDVSKLSLDSDDFNFQPPTDLTYDGNQKVASVTLKDDLSGTGKITLKYYDSNNNLVNGVPINAGRYTVKIDVAEGTDYRSTTDLTDESWTFEISKGTLSNVPNTEMNVTHSKDVTKVEDVNLPENWSWKQEYADVNLNIGGNTKAVAEYSGSDKQNYSNTEITITIATSNHTGGIATCVNKPKCEVCGQEYGITDSNKHINTTTVNVKEASCTEKGYTGDLICTDCQTILQKGTEIDMIAHQGGKATCLTQAICEVCNKPYGELDPSNHEDQSVIGKKDVTCTEDGYTGDTVCTKCNTVIAKGEIIKAKGHNCIVIKTVPSEHECGGTLVTYECNICHDYSYQQIEGAGHVYSEEYEEDIPATCTEKGSKSKHCIFGCGSVADVQEIPALGHSFTNYVSNNDATCTKDGTKTAKCDRCEASDTVIDVGSMVPHHGGMATCIKPATCEGCGKEYGEVDPDNHINTTVVGQVDVTCTKDGYTGETVCIDCGKTIVISVRIPATGHDYKVVNRVESQLPCGGEIVTYTCNNCGDTYSESISGQHVWSTEYTIDKEPTCMESGLQSRHCIYDGCTATTDWTYIEPLGHDFENYKSNNDATCEHNGTLTGTCSRCDETDTIVDEGSMLPHKGGTATCTTPAICEQCGNQYGEVDPDNHVDTALVNQKEASCTENGYTGDVICTGCKEVLVAGQVIESNDHQYENGVCIVCGATQSGTVTPIDPEKPDSTQKPDNTNNSNNASNNIVVNNNKDKTSNAVATGDDSQLSMYGSIVIGMIGLGCLIVVYRRKHLMK